MFIRISPVEYVCADEIISIKAIDAMTCIITTEAGVHTAEYPIETLLAILKGQEEPEKNDTAVLESINQKIGELPIFAG